MELSPLSKFKSTLGSITYRILKKFLSEVQAYPAITRAYQPISRQIRRLPFIQSALSVLYEHRPLPTHLEPPIYFLDNRLMSEREWYRRWKKYKKDFKPTKRKLSQGMADFSKSENPWAGPVISVLISLYKSDEYLDSFLSALQNQSIKQNTEFIFILVQPSKNTIAKVNAFAGSVQYVQIQYYDCRIGIYEAWNHGIRAATTEFLTNWNADDVRAPDSLEIQYLYLSAHLEVDVVYQDLYYSLEPNVPWEVLEAIGMQSNLPNVTAQYLIETKMNPPHNAPAWRRSLHEEFGFFDESYLSAGDYEFWEDFL